MLPVFVLTDTLHHIKKCGKSTKKSADGDAIAEMSSLKGLQMVPFVHDMQFSSAGGPDVIYLRALCWASYRKCVKYKVRIIVNTQGSPKILSAVCNKISLKDSNDVAVVDSIVGLIAKGSVLDLQLRDFSKRPFRVSSHLNKKKNMSVLHPKILKQLKYFCLLIFQNM